MGAFCNTAFLSWLRIFSCVVSLVFVLSYSVVSEVKIVSIGQAHLFGIEIGYYQYLCVLLFFMVQSYVCYISDGCFCLYVFEHRDNGAYTSIYMVVSFENMQANRLTPYPPNIHANIQAWINKTGAQTHTSKNNHRRYSKHMTEP